MKRDAWKRWSDRARHTAIRMCMIVCYVPVPTTLFGPLQSRASDRVSHLEERRPLPHRVLDGRPLPQSTPQRVLHPQPLLAARQGLRGERKTRDDAAMRYDVLFAMPRLSTPSTPPSSPYLPLPSSSHDMPSPPLPPLHTPSSPHPLSIPSPSPPLPTACRTPPSSSEAPPPPPPSSAHASLHNIAAPPSPAGPSASAPPRSPARCGTCV